MRGRAADRSPDSDGDGGAAARCAAVPALGVRMTAPLIPAPPSIDAGAVRKQIRRLIRRKRRSTAKAKSKFDADLIEYFMAGEDLVSAVAVQHNQALAAFRGMDGLNRVAWLLGNALPPEVPWEAVLGARSIHGRVPQMPAMLATAGKSYGMAQIKRVELERRRAETRAARYAHTLAILEGKKPNE